MARIFSYTDVDNTDVILVGRFNPDDMSILSDPSSTIAPSITLDTDLVLTNLTYVLVQSAYGNWIRATGSSDLVTYIASGKSISDNNLLLEVYDGTAILVNHSLFLSKYLPARRFRPMNIPENQMTSIQAALPEASPMMVTGLWFDFVKDQAAALTLIENS